MKSFFKFFISLLLAFIVVNLLYLFILPRLDWEFSKTKEAHNFKKQNFRVLVFGNSTAMDGINTEILSKKFGSSYNFSIGGASLLTNYTQFKSYLSENSMPEKVLLCLSSAHTNYTIATDVNPIVDYYYSDSSNLWRLVNMPLFRFRWLFVENLKKIVSSSNRSARIVRGQLRISRNVADNTKLFEKLKECNGADFYSNTGYDYMWKIAEVCNQRGIQLEVVELPCWKDVQNKCPDIILNRTFNGTQLNISMHNLNNYYICDSILNSEKDWLSRNHLNYYGSIKVTEKIASILVK